MEKTDFRIDNDFNEQDMFKNILKSVKIPFLIVGLDGKIKFFNFYYKKILGDVDLQIGMNFLKYIHPDDIKILKYLYEKGVKEKKSYLNEDIEFRIKRIDGKYIWVSTHTENYINDRGEFKGFISILKDISKKKELEYKYIKLKNTLEKFKKNEFSSDNINTSLNDIEKILEGICLLFNLAFDPNEVLFWMGIENISKLFTTFVQIILESTESIELQKKIAEIEIEFKVKDDGQGYLQLKNK